MYSCTHCGCEYTAPNSSDLYYRKGFGRATEVTQMLYSEYQSSLIQQIRENGYTLQHGNVTIKLAEAFRPQ